MASRSAVAKRLGRLASPPPADSGELRLVVLGSLGTADNPALNVLADALPVLRARWPKFECLYMGQHYHMLPDRLRQSITYPGRVSLETFERFVDRPPGVSSIAASAGLLWAVLARGSPHRLLRGGPSRAVLRRQGLGRGADARSAIAHGRRATARLPNPSLQQ